MAHRRPPGSLAEPWFPKSPPNTRAHARAHPSTMKATASGPGSRSPPRLPSELHAPSPARSGPTTLQMHRATLAPSCHGILQKRACP